MSDDAKDWFPTTSGKCSAWQPEYWDIKEDKWRDVPYKEIPRQEGGIPAPLFFGGLFATIGLCGYEQAMALAWQYAAQHAEIGMTAPKVRARQYEFVYDIKACAKPDDEISGSSATRGRGERS